MRLIGGGVSGAIVSGSIHGAGVLTLPFPPAVVSQTIERKETNIKKANRYLIIRTNYYPILDPPQGGIVQKKSSHRYNETSNIKEVSGPP